MFKGGVKMKSANKPILYCPCCKNDLVKVDTTEYKCDACDIVLDIVIYSVKDWEEANSIVVKD